ncbi:hypothetical protein ABZ920_08200 [Streptomyces sp. NPDC046831]|uniref:hypothetical protein n=1 Tax=Streptomyces sp. NPDC046831 TaxID=3154805 RepID=UPI0033DD254F
MDDIQPTAGYGQGDPAPAGLTPAAGASAAIRPAGPRAQRRRFDLVTDACPGVAPGAEVPPAA